MHSPEPAPDLDTAPDQAAASQPLPLSGSTMRSLPRDALSQHCDTSEGSGYFAQVSAVAKFTDVSPGFMHAIRADERRSDFVWDLYLYFKPLNEWADGLNDGIVFVHPAALHEAFGITMQQMSHLKRGHDYHPTSMVKGGRCSSQRLEDLVRSH